MIRILLLLSALWLGPDRALISWHQDTGLHCLYRQPRNGATVLVRCFDQPGSYGIQLGSTGPMDAAYRAAAGDVYWLRLPNGTFEHAPLKSVQYFPVWR